jgi:flagellar basal-body rod protein FlgG
MIRAFYSGSSGLKSQQNAVDITANNIANSETTGYKQKNEKFSDLLYSSMVGLGVNSANVARLEVGNGATISSVQNDMSAGGFQETGVSTNFAIEGNGFFAIKDSAGNTSYTRDGSFRATSEKDGVYLEDASGRKVLDKSQNYIKIDSVTLSTQPGVFGFANSTALQATGDNNYVETQLSGASSALDTPIKSGYLEGSNVNLAQQMTHLIVSQRSFQMSSKIVQTADQIAEMANQLR